MNWVKGNELKGMGYKIQKVWVIFDFILSNITSPLQAHSSHFFFYKFGTIKIFISKKFKSLPLFK